MLKEMRLKSSRAGDRLVEKGNAEDAKRLYWELALEVAGPCFQIPGIANQGEGGTRSERYVHLKPWERVNLAGCCNGLAECFLAEGNFESVSASRD